MSKKDNELGGEGLALSLKVFHKDGYDWPRISLAVYQDKKMDRLMIRCEEFVARSGWWKATNLPAELIPEFIKVLKEAEKVYNDRKK